MKKSAFIAISAAVFAALVTAELILFLPRRRQAEETVFDCKTFSDRGEYRKVMKKSEGRANVIGGKCSVDGVPCGQAYKVYSYPAKTLFPEDILAGKSVESSLKNAEYIWCVENNGIILSFALRNGEWQSAGSSGSFSNGAKPEIDYDAISAAAVKLSETGAKNITIQCLESRNYFGKYVFIYSSAGEYVVPFCYRPDFTGLENGKLYPATELAEILVKNLPADPTNWFPEEANAVSPTAKKHPVDFGNVAMYLSVTLVPLAMGIGVILYRKKKVCRS